MGKRGKYDGQRVNPHTASSVCITSALYSLFLFGRYLSDPTRSIGVIWVKIFKTVKTIEIHQVRLTEVCGKVLNKSEKCINKSVKTALLMSNVIDVDHQNSHFSSPLWVLISVLVKFHE